MAAVERIEPDGELHRAAEASLSRNLSAIVSAARRAGVPIVLSTLVSNERDLAPIASWTGDAGGPSAERRYEQGLALAVAGKGVEADAAFRQARDLDAMPWRAPAAMNGAIRALAAAQGVPLADVEAAFAKTSEGATRWRLFVDHVHPSLEGQFVLARAFYRVIASQRLLPLTAERDESWRALTARLGAHLLEHYVLVHKMSTLFSRPPIGNNNQRAAARLKSLLTRLEEAADTADSAALDKWQRASAEAGFALPISFLAGSASLQLGEPRRAAGYLRAAVESSFPYSDERCAAQLLLWVSRILLRDEPASLSEELERNRREAEWVARLPGQPSALLARTLHLYAALSGVAATATADGAAEPPLPVPAWMRTYLRELPTAETLVALRARLAVSPAGPPP